MLILMHVTSSNRHSRSKPGTHKQWYLPIVCVMHEELLAGTFHECGDKGLSSRLKEPLKGISCQRHVADPANEGHLKQQACVQKYIWQNYGIQYAGMCCGEEVKSKGIKLHLCKELKKGRLCQQALM